MLGQDYEGQDCSIARALEVVGERWTLLIVRDAFFGVRRFSDFQGRLDIPRAVLSDRLAGLVEQGILERKRDPQHAGRVLYELTPAGRDLWPVLNSLLAWGSRHRRRSSRVYKHATCNTTLAADGKCPKCEETPLPQDIVVAPRPGRGASRTDPASLALRKPHRLLEPIET